MFAEIYGVKVMHILLLATIIGGIIKYYQQGINYIGARIRASDLDINKSTESIIENLKENFISIQGQDNAKKMITEILIGWLESKNNPNEEKCGSLVFYFNGPSGVGKSMVADALTAALIGKKSEPIVISLSSIDKDSKKSTDEQLFGTKTCSDTIIKHQKETNLVTKLKSNPKTVVIFSDYNKLQKKDGSLEARLLDLSDNGVTYVDGQKIDCSDTIFILMSNDDGTDSETPVENNQIINIENVVRFENLEQENYYYLISRRIKDIQEFYADKYNILFDIDKISLKLLADEIRQLNRGARETRDYTRKLYTQLMEYRSQHIAGNRRPINPIILRVKYDPKEKNFVFSEKE